MKTATALLLAAFLFPSCIAHHGLPASDSGYYSRSKSFFGLPLGEILFYCPEQVDLPHVKECVEVPITESDNAGKSKYFTR